MNGFVVTIGCEQVVVSGKNMIDAIGNLTKQLEEYLIDRSSTESAWCKVFRLNRPTGGIVVNSSTGSFR